MCNSLNLLKEETKGERERESYSEIGKLRIEEKKKEK